jgi:hypothetical protein
VSKIFISYARQSKALVKTLADDIESLGHTVWFDQELSGGRAWWDQILNEIRCCDRFVFILAPGALDSTACQREHEYAADLGRPILPVLVADGVSMNILPPALSAIQYVDYRNVNGRAGALQLARALTNMPEPKPLPNPLPAPPGVPLSYLGNLAEQVMTEDVLSQQQQSDLVVNLKRSLKDHDTASDGRMLLEKLRDRQDLLATTAEEIDELLAASTASSSSQSQAPKQDEFKKPTIETNHLSRMRRAFLLFGPSTTKAWLIHIVFYILLLFCGLALIGLSLQPTDPSTGENTLAYGLFGMVLLFGLPLLLLQRVAIRFRSRS